MVGAPLVGELIPGARSALARHSPSRGARPPPPPAARGWFDDLCCSLWGFAEESGADEAGRRAEDTTRRPSPPSWERPHDDSYGHKHHPGENISALRAQQPRLPNCELTTAPTGRNVRAPVDDERPLLQTAATGRRLRLIITLREISDTIG